MLKSYKTLCTSEKLSRVSALLGLVGLVAFCLYATLFRYFDLAVLLTIAVGVVSTEGYLHVGGLPGEFLNLLGVGCYAYALGLFFLNSYPVWADWYGHFTMYGSRGGIAPVIAIMAILLAGCLTGIISCFTVKKEVQQ